jgi:hypothetical protein
MYLNGNKRFNHVGVPRYHLRNNELPLRYRLQAVLKKCHVSMVTSSRIRSKSEGTTFNRNDYHRVAVFKLLLEMMCLDGNERHDPVGIQRYHLKEQWLLTRYCSRNLPLLVACNDYFFRYTKICRQPA